MSDNPPRRILRCRRGEKYQLPDEPIDGLARFARPGWWSQTGSNRRPPACKAGALPTELWPLVQRQTQVGAKGWLAEPKARAQQSPAFALSGSGAAAFPRRATEGWWAWEDLNFRPHAYQARALTN